MEEEIERILSMLDAIIIVSKSINTTGGTQSTCSVLR